MLCPNAWSCPLYILYYFLCFMCFCSFWSSFTFHLTVCAWRAALKGYLTWLERVCFLAWTAMQLWCGVFLRPIAARLSKCPPFFLSVKLVTFFPMQRALTTMSRNFNILLPMVRPIAIEMDSRPPKSWKFGIFDINLTLRGTSLELFLQNLVWTRESYIRSHTQILPLRVYVGVLYNLGRVQTADRSNRPVHWAGL